MIIDANIALGRFSGGNTICYERPEYLIKDIHRFGIDKAVVHSTLARESDWLSGNMLMMEQIKDYEELIPCWVLMPEFIEMENAVRKMQEYGIKAVRLFPKSGNYKITLNSIGNLAEYLQANKKILFIDFESGGWSDNTVDWNMISEICSKFPSLNLVVIGATISSPRNYRDILKKHLGLKLEISQLYCPEEIKKICDSRLASQLIFGSGLPRTFAGGMLSLLDQEYINEKDLNAILGVNTAELFEINSVRENKSACKDKPARKNEKTTIIDMHLHHGRFNSLSSGTGQREDILSNMNRNGISRAFVSSLWACYGDVHNGNKAVADLCRKNPDRFFGYITINAKFPEEVNEEIKKYGNQPGFKGFKFHCDLHKTDIEDEGYKAALTFANKRKWPVLIHWTWNKEPQLWAEMCSTYPNVKFLIAHIGGGSIVSENYRKIADLCRKHKNLFLDLTASKMESGFLEKLVEWAGIGQIVYGSDYPLFDMGYETGRITYSVLSDRQKEMILHGNAEKILMNTE